MADNTGKSDDSGESSRAFIRKTANEFFAKARDALNSGDEEAATKMLRAGLALLGEKGDGGEPPKRPDSEVSRVSAKLKEGWIEASDLGNALGISNSRLHAVLARIRGTRGVKLEKRTRNEYRIVD